MISKYFIDSRAKDNSKLRKDVILLKYYQRLLGRKGE